MAVGDRKLDSILNMARRSGEEDEADEQEPPRGARRGFGGDDI